MSITGIILAGGKSIRMGQDKGLFEMAGKPMIQHVIDHIEPLCDQILISANMEEYKRFGYPVDKDDIKDIGPVGGIISCLPHAKNEKCVIISCDLPFVSTEMLKKLIILSSTYEITIPRIDEYLQPLCGIYVKKIFQKVKCLVQEGQFSIQNIVQQFDLNIVDQSDLKNIDVQSELRNINRLSDLARFNR